MTPDAKLRMEVYQQGQRAYRSGAPCPYSDWKAKTWEKGRQAAREYWERVLSRIPEPESTPQPNPCPCCGEYL